MSCACRLSGVLPSRSCNSYPQQPQQWYVPWKMVFGNCNWKMCRFFVPYFRFVTIAVDSWASSWNYKYYSRLWCGDGDCCCYYCWRQKLGFRSNSMEVLRVIPRTSAWILLYIDDSFLLPSNAIAPQPYPCICSFANTSKVLHWPFIDIILATA